MKNNYENSIEYQVPFISWQPEGLIYHFPDTNTILSLQKSSTEAQQNIQSQLLLKLSQILAMRKNLKVQEHYSMNHSLIHQKLLAQQFDEIRELFHELIDQIFEQCDRAQYTSNEQKVSDIQYSQIFYATLDFFLLLIKNESTFAFKKQNSTVVQSEEFLAWLKKVLLLFQQLNSQYCLYDGSIKDPLIMQIIEFVQNHEYQQVLLALNRVQKQLQNSNAPQIIFKCLQMANKLSLKRVLWVEKMAEEKQNRIVFNVEESQINSLMPMIEEIKKLKKSKYSVHIKNLGQVLIDSCCLMIGQTHLIIGYEKLSMLKKIKLALQFNEYSEEIELKEFVDYLGFERVPSTTSLQLYLLDLIKNQNYHSTYQQSLQLLPQFYSSLLGLLAFIAQIPHSVTIRFDSNYQLNIQCDLFASISGYPFNDQIQGMKVLTNLISFSQKWLSPSDPQENNSFNELDSQGPSYQDALIDLKKKLLKKYCPLTTCLWVNENRKSIETKQLYLFKCLVTQTLRLNMFYLIEQYFNNVLSYYLISNELTPQVLSLMIFDLSCTVELKSTNYSYSDEKVTRNGYRVFSEEEQFHKQSKKEVDLTEQELYMTLTVTALQNDLLNRVSAVNPFDYSLLSVLKQIKIGEPSQQNFNCIRSQKAINFFKNFFEVYFMLEQVAKYLEKLDQSANRSMEVEGQYQFYEPNSFFSKRQSIYQIESALGQFLEKVKMMSEIVRSLLDKNLCKDYSEVLRTLIKFTLCLKKCISEGEEENNESISGLMEQIKESGGRALTQIRDYLDLLKSMNASLMYENSAKMLETLVSLTY